MSTLKVNPVMYLLVQKDHGMSAGKMAAQVAHAAVEAYKASPDDRLKHIWDECGKHYAKIVLQTDNLFLTNLYLCERHFMPVPIVDEGRTELTGDLTLTALGIPILDKNRADVQATFSAFKLYRDPEPENLPARRLSSFELADKIVAEATPEQLRAAMLPTPKEEKRSFIRYAKEQLLRADTSRRGS